MTPHDNKSENTNHAASAMLGPVRAEFFSGSLNLLAGKILIFGSLLAGLSGLTWIVYKVFTTPHPIPFEDKHGFSWAKAMVLGLVSVTALGASLFFRIYVSHLRSQRTYICEHGIFFLVGTQGTAWPWNEIVAVKECFAAKYFPLKGPIKYLMPVGKKVTYTVVHQDGRQISIDKDQANEIDQLGECLKKRSMEQNIAWIVEEPIF